MWVFITKHILFFVGYLQSQMARRQTSHSLFTDNLDSYWTQKWQELDTFIS